jgi:hypothetical protein
MPSSLITAKGQTSSTDRRLLTSRMRSSAPRLSPLIGWMPFAKRVEPPHGSRVQHVVRSAR